VADFFQRALGLSITASCPIACPHCIVEAGPHRRETIELDVARSALSQAAAFDDGRIRSVVFTGGEPFFRPHLLDSLIAQADALGFVVSVMTNAFWARDAERALEFLRVHPHISQLTVSTDRNHRLFIPISAVRNAVRAAKALSIPVSVAVCLESMEDLEPSFCEVSDFCEPEKIRFSFALPAGRAAAHDPQTDRPPCSPETHDACASLDVPLIFPDGRVLACMGMVPSLPLRHPLYLGAVTEEPLEAILNRGRASEFIALMRRSACADATRALGLTSASAEGLRRFRRFGNCALCYALLADSGLLDEVSAALGDGGSRSADGAR